MVQYESAAVLGNDNSTVCEFIDSCRQCLISKYKYNIGIIQDIVKNAYGKHSYFRLLKCGLYREHQFEGDYYEEVLDDADNEGNESDCSNHSNSNSRNSTNSAVYDEDESTDDDDDCCSRTGSLDDI